MEEARFVVRRRLDTGCMRALDGIHRRPWVVRWILFTAYVLYIADVWRMFAPGQKAVFAVVVVITAVLLLFMPRITAWRMSRRLNPKMGEEEFRFCEDILRVSSNLQSGEIKYDTYLHLVETRGYFVLYIQNRLAHVIPKSAFVQGDPADFAAFIQEKTGLKLEKRNSK